MTLEEYAAWVDEIERERAEAEGKFRAALAAGLVLAEHWLIGVAPCVTIWTGRERWNNAGYETAAHVANRFRAGWTRVEAMPEAEAVRRGYRMRG